MIKIKFRRFIARYFGWLAKIYFSVFIHLQLKFNDKPIILILTPGKVGSSTLYFNLKQQLNQPIFHIHRLSKKGIEKSKKDHMDSDRKSLPLHLIISEILSREININKDRIKIVTIIREPISRYVSSFFQNIEFYKNSIEKSDLTIDINGSLGFLYSNFNEQICIDLADWFRSEIEEPLNLNILDIDTNSKYYFGNYNSFFILLRLEDINSNWQHILFLLTGEKINIPMKNFNIGDKKYYSDSYNKVKKDLKIEPKVFDNITAHVFYKKFYSDLIPSSKEKWVRN
ncbi:MAG: sulfotransferase family 2 domain-containing protein [Flavobacteriaceae bacterium]|nr:sulfotransferase family 2 domain-containing protein [Flavobacteriaceae bacterium]